VLAVHIRVPFLLGVGLVMAVVVVGRVHIWAPFLLCVGQ
jgi:hypothetical protein